MANREFKGKSLLDFPSDYVIVDIETTGLSPEHDYIIEVSGIRYADGVEVERFSSLVQTDSCYIDDYITALTNISSDMVTSAPEPKVVLDKFKAFIGGSLIVGHNVNFDINFLYDNFLKYCGEPLSNDFVDTMRLSRFLHPEEKHHTLSDLADRYGLSYSGAHRAVNDCEITRDALIALADDARSQYGSCDEFLSIVNEPRKKVKLKASDIQSQAEEFDISHPLYGKTCVFTGALCRMTRKEAMQLVVNVGGLNGDSVTKKTNYLILGNNDYCSSIKDGKSSKQKKAEQLKLKGQDISIIPESVFYDMLEE